VREFHFFFFVRHLPRCQIGVLAGLLSTSHFRLTDIPSTIGIPKPGKRVIANDGVSETGIKQLVSMPRRRCTPWYHRETWKKNHKISWKKIRHRRYCKKYKIRSIFNLLYFRVNILVQTNSIMKFKFYNENSRLIGNSEDISNCELQSYFADDSKSASSQFPNKISGNLEMYWPT